MAKEWTICFRRAAHDTPTDKGMAICFRRAHARPAKYFSSSDAESEGKKWLTEKFLSMQEEEAQAEGRTNSFYKQNRSTSSNQAQDSRPQEQHIQYPISKKQRTTQTTKLKTEIRLNICTYVYTDSIIPLLRSSTRPSYRYIYISIQIIIRIVRYTLHMVML